MHYKTSIAILAFVGSAVAVPTPQPLNGHSPDVAALATGPGLGSLAPSLESTPGTLGSDVKAKSQAPGAYNLLVAMGLIPKSTRIDPKRTGPGGSLPDLESTPDTLDSDVKAKRQLLFDHSPPPTRPHHNGPNPTIDTLHTPSSDGQLVFDHSPPPPPPHHNGPTAVEDTLETVDSDVKVKRQLVNDLAPDVAALLAGLNLGSLAPAVKDTLETVGSDVKVIKRQLLKNLGPDVAALVNGIGLGSLTPDLESALKTVVSNIKDKRPLLEGLTSDVASLIAGLGLGSLAPDVQSPPKTVDTHTNAKRVTGPRENETESDRKPLLA